MRGERLKHWVTGVLGSLAGLLMFPAAGPADDWPEWALQEEQLRQRIEAVNEGELTFLVQPPAGRVHHHRSQILISAQSLTDGWVLLEQCHDGIDPVATAEIVFNPERSRALQVVSFRDIEAAYAEASTVQLRGIGVDPEVCLRLESRALHPLGDGVFELRNGPFMRRFLDGFYPLRLSLRVDYPATLKLVDVTPADQPGFTLSEAPGRAMIDAMFEGRLHTRLRFVTR